MGSDRSVADSRHLFINKWVIQFGLSSPEPCLRAAFCNENFKVGGVEGGQQGFSGSQRVEQTPSRDSKHRQQRCCNILAANKSISFSLAAIQKTRGRTLTGTRRNSHQAVFGISSLHVWLKRDFKNESCFQSRQCSQSHAPLWKCNQPWSIFSTVTKLHYFYVSSVASLNLFISSLF